MVAAAAMEIKCSASMAPVMRAIDAMCNTLLPLRLLAGAVPELTDVHRIKLNGQGRSPRRRSDLRRRLGGQGGARANGSRECAPDNRCRNGGLCSRQASIVVMRPVGTLFTPRKKRPGRKAWAKK